MNTAALRTLVIYAVILPLAVFMGWILSGDMTKTSFAVLSAVVFVLLLPLLLKWHYVVLIFSWNTFITIFFLPGQPFLWMLMAGINFGIAILNRIVQKRPAFLPAPSISMSLLALGAVVVVTAWLHGGIGLRSLGSSTYGGKGYALLIAAIVGYFAFASQPIPAERAKFYVGLFFLSGLVTAGSNLIYYAGPSFYVLFLLFPVSFAAVQAGSDYGGMISRVAGFGTAAAAGAFFLLALNGVRGVLTKWWRVFLFAALIAFGALSGFRSIVVLIGLTFMVLFFAEGLFRTAIFPMLLLVGALCFSLLIPGVSYLPQSIQRSISFIPGLPVDPLIKADAQHSIDWRQRMWAAMLPDLPKYLWLGKGYVLNPTDMYLAQEASRRNLIPDYQGALLAGNYHNGPLSVYVPFGSFGALAFLVFLCVSLRALYLNSRYGGDTLKTLNRFLFAYFIARVIFFFFGFGDLSNEFYTFTGTVGLSVALNKGICRKPLNPLPKPIRFRSSLELGSPQPGAA